MAISFLTTAIHSQNLSSTPSVDYIVDVQQFGLEDGLPHQNIKDITEDKNGFIWISTPKGIARYDGYNFKWFNNKNRTGKIDNILSLELDKDGWLWLLNYELGTIIFLHPESEEILTVEERFNKPLPFSFGSNGPYNQTHKNILPWVNGSIKKDKSGNLIFSESSGNNLILYKGEGKFETIAIKQHVNPKTIIEDDKGSYWWSAYFNIYQLNLSDHTLRSYSSLVQGQTLSCWNDKIFFKTNLRKGDLLTLENGQDSLIKQSFSAFYQLDTDGRIKEVFKPPTGYRANFFKQGKFWCLGKVGWKVYGENGNLLFELPRTQYKKSLFEALNIHQGGNFLDTKGRIWFLGEFGLSVVRIKENVFTNYFTDDGEKSLPFNNSGRGIWANKEELLVNFEFGGLVNIKKDNPKDYTIIAQHSFYWDVTKTKNSYLGRPLLRDPNNNTWIGHRDYIIKWSPDFSKKETYYLSFNGTGHNKRNTFALYQDEVENMWVGTIAGLEVLKPNSDSVQLVLTNNDSLNSTIFITNIIPASDTSIWLCGKTGLYLFNSKRQKLIARYAPDVRGANYLPAHSIHHIHIDTVGDKWIATSEGLIHWNNKTNEKRLMTLTDGLSSEEIVAIFEDKHQHLWLGSRYGIMQFDKKEFRVVNTFLPKDGPSYHRTNRISHFQSEDGTIYFGGYNGITSFHPDDFYREKRETSDKMVITNFEQFDGASNKLLNRTGDITQSRTITLQPEDRFFNLQFALLNYTGKNENRYAWKIEGVDKDWNYQKEPFIRLSQQPYGQYLLRIKGQGRDGIWSSKELSIHLNVVKPFYLQNWFFLLSIVTFLGGVYRIFKWRTSRFTFQQKILEKEVRKATAQIAADKAIIENQAKELRQLDKMKSNFFANVSHELRTPLTLMLGPISSALKSENLNNRNFTLLKLAQQSGKDLLKLVGSILDLSKMESGKIELEEQPVVLYSLVRRIVSTFESYAENEKILLTFNYQAEKDLQLLIDKDKLEVIFNNLLSNALKFTPKNGKIEIDLKDEENAIQIEVRDSGRGIHPNDLPHIFNRFYQSKQSDAPTEGGTGIGLALSQEFIKLMNGSIWVESDLGKGSTFYLKIPRKEVFGMVELSKERSDDSIITKKELIGNPIKAIKEEGITQPKVLIIEDNRSLRNYIANILSPNYTLILKENGRVALDYLETKLENKALPDLIVSDIMMPEMDGFQFLKAVRAHSLLKQIPVIMLTARANMEDKLKALRIGVDDYLLKPFEEEELLVRIDNLIHNAQERRVFNKLLITEKKEERPTISQEDTQWLEDLEVLVNTYLSDIRFSIPQMAQELAMSERNLQRQIKKLTGLTPNQYLQEVRLNEGRKLLEIKKYNTVAKVAYSVGFTDAKNFSRRFKQRFGKSPSEY